MILLESLGIERIFKMPSNSIFPTFIRLFRLLFDIQFSTEVSDFKVEFCNEISISTSKVQSSLTTLFNVQKLENL